MQCYLSLYVGVNLVSVLCYGVYCLFGLLVVWMFGLVILLLFSLGFD